MAVRAYLNCESLPPPVFRRNGSFYWVTRIRSHIKVVKLSEFPGNNNSGAKENLYLTPNFRRHFVMDTYAPTEIAHSAAAAAVAV